MKICRYLHGGQPHLGLLKDPASVQDFGEIGINSLAQLLESPDPRTLVSETRMASASVHSLDRVKILAPVDHQEIWAAGVTYLRSKKARMEESDFSANAYDRVYEAARPELFFKSLPEKTIGHRGAVGIRRDAKWSVPEPELALVINSKGRIAGYTIGNDMSSRDIEGENLLYLPQAKIYRQSCALGPCIVFGPTENEARSWSVKLEIVREEKTVFQGETSIDQIKRSFEELVNYLFRSQEFPHGAVLLTGTGIVPPDNFSLQAQDRVRMEISGIGTLENSVEVV